MKNNTLIHILLILFFSCSEKKHNTENTIKIDINENKTQNSLDVSLKDVVPLETTDSSLIGVIMSIEFFSDKIYILDVFSSKALMAFNKNGKYINKTKLGKGPEEMINPFAFCIDRNRNEILVWDQTDGAIFTYNLNLDYLSKDRYFQLHVLEFAKLSNDEVLVRSHYDNDFVFTLYSSNFDSVINKFVEDFKYDGIQGLSRSITSENRVFFISPFDYNVYELLDDEIHSEYYYDFGKYQITQEEVEKEGVQGTWKLIRSGEKVSTPSEIDASNDYLLFHVFYKQEKIFFLQSLENKVIYRLNHFFNENKLPKCEIRGFIDNNTLYGIVKPADLIEFQQKSGKLLVQDEIDIQQNPIFISFSIM